MPTSTTERRSLQSPSVIKAAMHAVHWMILNARMEALDWTHGRKPVDADRMARLLDTIELFPDLIKHDWDGAYDYFRKMLELVGADYPQFAGLLTQFDQDVAAAENVNGIGATSN
jgi:hypothetical protein